MAIVIADILNAQTTIDNNTPQIGAFLGWGDFSNTELLIRQNNLQRMRFSSVVHNTADGSSYQSASRIFFGLNGVNMPVPFSMHHLGLPASNHLNDPG